MLSDIDLYLLDIIINLEPLHKHNLYEFWLTKNKKLTEEEINESINKLLSSSYISVKKDEYDWEIVTINSDKKDEVSAMLASFWKEKVQKEKLLEIAGKNEQEILKFLELKMSDEGKTYLIVSDYYYDQQSFNFCQKLLNINMVFKTTWSSKTHYYEKYYLRKIPIDVENELRNYISSKVDVEGFRLDVEWRILLLPMLIESPISIADVETIFPNLTRDEVLEILKGLERKKVLTISSNKMSIPKVIRDIVRTNFLLKKYPSFELLMIEQLRKRIGESVSNLYLLGIVRKILTTYNFRLDGPFAIIEKSSITDVNLNDLKQASKLGIVFLTESHIIIAKKVLEELESVLKSKIFERVIRIPANDIYTATSTLRKIFGEECKEYIKIQDEFINEDTLRILQSYSPPGINITILTSIEGSRDLDVEEMKRIVNEIKRSGRGLKLFFIGTSSGKAPFHFRYIISKDICYSVTTSIKQVGKSKDADLIPISKREKEGLIEPAFDYWIGLPKDKLKEKGITRMEFEEWISYKFAS